MVFDIIHKIKYVIEFKEPVDYFDVILQKQIDMRLKFYGNENELTLINLDSYNERLSYSKFFHTYEKYFMLYNKKKSFFELINSPYKYEIIINIFQMF